MEGTQDLRTGLSQARAGQAGRCRGWGWLQIDRVSGNPKKEPRADSHASSQECTQPWEPEMGVQRWAGVGSYKALYLGHLVSWGLPVASDPEICPSTLPSPSFLQGPGGGCLLLSPHWSHWAVCARIRSVPQDREHWQGRPLRSPTFKGRARHHHHNNDPIRNGSPAQKNPGSLGIGTVGLQRRDEVDSVPIPTLQMEPLRHRELDSFVPSHTAQKRPSWDWNPGL